METQRYSTPDSRAVYETRGINETATTHYKLLLVAILYLVQCILFVGSFRNVQNRITRAVLIWGYSIILEFKNILVGVEKL